MGMKKNHYIEISTESEGSRNVQCRCGWIYKNAPNAYSARYYSMRHFFDEMVGGD
jgi:hypothetical protein